MKLSDYVIKTLGDYGIHKAFVVYGSACGNLIDSFVRIKNIEYIAVMHEQGASFMAEGWAKIKGKPGVAIATSGPGGMNLVTGIGNCFYDSVPCLFLTGQINSRFLRPDPSIRQIGFQETDIVSIVSPITKYAKMIMRPEDIRYELEKALFICQDRRPGPVLLDLPIDVQAAEIEPDKLIGFDTTVARVPYKLSQVDEQIKRYVEDLHKAERPVLMIGGGVRIAGAEEKVRELGRLLAIPCFPTWNALSTISSDYEYYAGRIGTYGGAGRNFGIQNSDLLLAIGSRISGRITGGNVQSFARGAKKYVVDVDPPMLQRHLQQLPFDENILCDAKVFCEMLIDAIRPRRRHIPSFISWTSKVMGWKTKYDPVRREFFENQDHVHPYAFMRILSEKMGPDDIFVADCGGNIVVCNHAFETKWGQRYITNNGNSPMGFSMCGAIGAWLADPSKRVVCVIGDGGMNMNIQELQTIKTNQIAIKVFILNNHCYGITKQYQEVNFGGRYEACGPKGYSPPPFIAIATVYGLTARYIDSTEHMSGMIDEVLEFPGPIICDVDCGDHHDYGPRLTGWNTPLEDLDPKLPRDEFRSNMIIEPLPGWEKGEY